MEGEPPCSGARHVLLPEEGREGQHTGVPGATSQATSRTPEPTLIARCPQFVPIAPGPEDKRKLPAELAVRFDDIKHRAGRLVAASVRAECKTGGATVADLPVGKFRIESS